MPADYALKYVFHLPLRNDKTEQWASKNLTVLRPDVCLWKGEGGRKNPAKGKTLFGVPDREEAHFQLPHAHGKKIRYFFKKIRKSKKNILANKISRNIVAAVFETTIAGVRNNRIER